MARDSQIVVTSSCVVTTLAVMLGSAAGGSGGGGKSVDGGGTDAMLGREGPTGAGCGGRAGGRFLCGPEFRASRPGESWGELCLIARRKYCVVTVNRSARALSRACRAVHCSATAPLAKGWTVCTPNAGLPEVLYRTPTWQGANPQLAQEAEVQRARACRRRLKSS